MNKKVFLSLLFPLVFLEFGCATYGLIIANPSKNQKAIFQDGLKSIVSHKKNTVIITPLEEKFSSGQRGDFLIKVKNGSKKDFLFSTDNIFASSTNPGLDEKKLLKIFSYEDLIKEEEDRRTWAAISAAIQGVSDSINAQNAGYSTTYGTYTYGNKGYGSYSSTTYDYAAAQAARSQATADSNERFSKIEQEDRKTKNDLSLTILKKETIFPNSWYGGIVKIGLPKLTETNGTLTIMVTTNKEKHIFNFTYSKIKKLVPSKKIDGDSSSQ